MLTSEERIINTLKLEKTDRIPTYEWTIDKKIIEAISPGKDYREFVNIMDLDALCISLNYKIEKLGKGIYKDEWGIKHKYNEEQHSYPFEGCIKTMGDFNSYTPPDSHSEYRFDNVKKVLKENFSKKAVILHLNDVVSIPRNLMGYQSFLINIMENPKLIQGLVELSVDLNLELAKEAVKRGIKIVYTGDDFAYTKGLLMPLNIFKKIFYPGFRRVIKGFKELGLFVIKHTDGNIKDIIEMIINAEIDCLDPIDPMSGMDLYLIKKKFGKKVALKGNVDCAKTLTFGTISDVIKETKESMKAGAYGGGFILSSSNSIHSGVKPENYLAMLYTLRTFGDYYLNGGS